VNGRAKTEQAKACSYSNEGLGIDPAQDLESTGSHVFRVPRTPTLPPPAPASVFLFVILMGIKPLRHHDSSSPTWAKKVEKLLTEGLLRLW
jgi:hypothetical protein